MAFIVKDRVQETCSAPGTGSISLLGALTGFQSFSSAIGNTNTTFYTIADQVGANWEVGIGTYSSSGNTLARTTVLASSNGGSLVNFSSGTQNVWGDYPAGKSVYQDAGGVVTVPIFATNSTTNTTPTLSFNAANSAYAGGASISASYLQFLLQNKSGTVGASTNYVLSNDLGTDSTYYGEFGMNSSVFSASTPTDFFSINNGVYFSGHDGDVIVGSGNGFKHYMAWGTSGQSAHVINAAGALGLSTNLGTTPALSGTTGYGTSGQVLASQGSAAAPIWLTLPTNAVTTTSQTATSGQTVFTTTYTVGLLWVYRNGVLLNSADFTATNGTSVTLGVGATAGDTVTFVAFAPYSLSSATGTGNAVLQTSPTINTPTITSPIITGSAPQVTTYASGSGTYTTPANARYLIVEMVGGGGGGSGGGTGGFAAAGNGGSTSFGSSTATGGSGGPGSWSGVGGAGGSISIGTGTNIGSTVGAYGGGCQFTATGNTGYAVGGGAGGSSFYGGAGVGGTYVAGGSAAASNSGSGGGGGAGGNDTAQVYTGCGGGAGALIRVLVNSPAATYSYAVGAGGAGHAAGTGSNAASGGAGGSGWLSITAYF